MSQEGFSSVVDLSDHDAIAPILDQPRRMSNSKRVSSPSPRNWASAETPQNANSVFVSVNLHGSLFQLSWLTIERMNWGAEFLFRGKEGHLKF